MDNTFIILGTMNFIYINRNIPFLRNSDCHPNCSNYKYIAPGGAKKPFQIMKLFQITIPNFLERKRKSTEVFNYLQLPATIRNYP